MRFFKGSKIEVLNKEEVPSGSWWCAEIISGNGHTYYVKYDRYSGEMRASVARVPRKAIRPCPPFVEPPRSWAAGDIVEVFDNYSWKLAEVSKVAGGSYFSVRLLGSSMEFRAHSSDIRLRQTWKDNRWVVIHKDSGKCNEGATHRPYKEGKFICDMPMPHFEEKNYTLDRHYTIEEDNALEVFPQILTKCTKKRPCVCSLPIETCTGANGKMRAITKEGRHQGLVAQHSSRSLEKGKSRGLVKLASISAR